MVLSIFTLTISFILILASVLFRNHYHRLQDKLQQELQQDLDALWQQVSTKLGPSWHQVGTRLKNFLNFVQSQDL